MTRLQAAIGSIIFFVVMPGVVAGLIPTLITGGWVTPPLFGLFFLPWIGWALAATGTVLLIDCFVHFVRQRGTPAPIAPTARLVVAGAYRHVRNPMYVAVISIIFGQALIYGCHWVILYGLGIWLFTHLFIRFYEEPTLMEQFPADYPAYMASVPRWIPRLSAWSTPEPT